MKKNISNPYDYVNPIRSKELFAGRHGELKEIKYYLELSKSKKPKYFHLALVGTRSVGKTSLLNMIECIANNLGLLAVKTSLNMETTKNDVLFFKEAFDGIITKGAEKKMYGGFTGKIYKTFRRVIDTLDIKAEIPLLFGTAYIGLKRNQNVAGIPQPVLIHDLKEIYNEARKKGIPTIVLLFDECDLLAQNEVVLQKIRNAFMEVEGYVLVFSGTENMFPAISNVFSPIPRFFKRVNVGNFKDIKETEECLLKPLDEKEKKFFDRACIGEIHRITNGSPYEINLIAHYMYRRWKEGKISKIGLSVEVLDDVLNEIERLREEGHHEIANKIKRYWIGQLKVLISLLEFPNVPKEWLAEYMLLDEIDTLQLKDTHIKKSITKDYIAQLERDGVISKENGRIRFKGDQFDVLYLKYFCASKAIRDVKGFFVGLPEDSITNLHHKFIEGVLLKDFQEYKIHTGFDKREQIDGKTGQRFIIGAKVHLPPGEHTVLEISPETTKEFYLGKPNSVRFRVNVEWMKEGFVTQISLKNEEEKEKLLNRLNSLKDKLEFMDYKIILEDEITWNNKGSEFSKEKNWTKAIECFNKAIEINPLFELPWANEARIFFNLKKHDEALECVNKTLELRSSWPEALKLKGMILINLKKNEEALECLGKATKLNPEDWSVWDNRGRALFNLKKYGKAVECFDSSLKLKSENYEVLNLKGLSLLHLGRNDEAIKCFNNALKINPDFVNVLLVKGEVLLDKKDYDEALNCFDAVLRKESSNIDALILKGLALSELGQYKKARGCCDKVLKINPNNGVAWYDKACFEAKLGDVDDAFKCLSKAIEINKSFIEMAKKEENLITLKNDDRFLSLIKKDAKNK